MKILTVNAGSSSLKFNVVVLPEGNELINGYFEKIGIEGSFYTIKINGEKFEKEVELKNFNDAISFLKQELFDNNVISDFNEIAGIGHRVVHGGDKYSTSVVIDEDVINNISACSPLAPLHNPSNLLCIKTFMEMIPGVKNVAVFDTAFHQTMPEVNFLYPVPYEWYSEYGIRKYGFHGTSHKYITESMIDILKKDSINIISCHIGSGASLCCVKDSKSYDTTMGFTPNAGVMMGTRSGDVDYTMIPYFMSKSGKTLDEVDTILNKKSGLLGVTEKFSDNRDIEKAVEAGDERAILAWDLFVDRIVKYITDYYVKLAGKVDAIVFTAGVGENGIKIRRSILAKLECLGIKVDSSNENIARYKDIKEGIISTEDSSVMVYVKPTDEEYMIAKDTFELVK